jgi:hypothetical protein
VRVVCSHFCEQAEGMVRVMLLLSMRMTWLQLFVRILIQSPSWGPWCLWMFPGRLLGVSGLSPGCLLCALWVLLGASRVILGVFCASPDDSGWVSGCVYIYIYIYIYIYMFTFMFAMSSSH